MKKKCIWLLIDVFSIYLLCMFGNKKFFYISIIALSATFYSLFLTYFFNLKNANFDTDTDRKRMRKVFFTAPFIYLPVILLAILLEFKVLFPAMY